jgi:folate-dependent phosphoribosylglycinamide formyltransferase PurN
MLRPLRVAVLTSRRAPGLADLLHGGRPGAAYEIAAAVVTDPEGPALAELRAAGVRTWVHDLRAFCRARGAPLRDLDARRAFDRATGELLAGARPDLVVLCGYLHIVTAPLLEAYPWRIVNVHDSDLTVCGPDGLPRYRGLHATRDAVFAGEPETRSTVHLVTPDVDVGPLLVRSWAFPTHPLVAAARGWGAADILKAYAYAQREWMMRAAWGRLLVRTVMLFARGEVRVAGGRATIAGAAGPVGLAPVASVPPVAPPAPASAARALTAVRTGG